MKSVSELNSLTVGAVILSALPEGTLRIYGKDLSELDKLIKGIFKGCSTQARKLELRASIICFFNRSIAEKQQ